MRGVTRYSDFAVRGDRAGAGQGSLAGGVPVAGGDPGYPLLHASFGPNLAIVALVLRYPSLFIRLVGDFHPQAVEHARHSLQEPVTMSPVPAGKGAQTRKSTVSQGETQMSPGWHDVSTRVAIALRHCKSSRHRLKEPVLNR